jgi:glycosyltransferase involved in cell wall biosynthesis
MKLLNISVIIPCYNSEKYIEKSIFSVLKQNYSIKEILIVDDCSTDNSVNIIKTIIKNNSSKTQITLLQNKINHGPSYTRNIGLKNISINTDYISFLDADDFWSTSKISNQVDLIKSKNIDFVYSFYQVYDEVKNKTFIPDLNFKYSFDLRQKLLKFNLISGSSSSVMISNEVFKKVGFFDESLWCGEDWDYWIRCIEYSKVDCTEKIDVTICTHANNSQKSLFDMYKTKIYFWNKRAKEKNIHLPSFFKDMVISKFYPSYLPFPNKSFMISFFFPNNKALYLLLSCSFAFLFKILKFCIRLFRYLKRKLINA